MFLKYLLTAEFAVNKDKEELLVAKKDNNIKASIAWIKMEEKAKKPCTELKNQTWFINSLTVRKDLQGQGIGTDMIFN